MQAKSAAWSIGVARRQITPPLGCQMAGFDARKDVARSIHDDLHARALVFEDGNNQVVFVSVEVIAVSAEFAASVRSQIESVTGVPASHIFVCATHTHCGPVTLHHFFNQGQPLDDDYLLSLRSGIVAAVRQAFEEKKPRTLKTGLVKCDGIAVNRRTPDGLPVDPYAGVLLVEELDGTRAAVAVIYACHTTVLGPDTLSITQDFPFYTLGKLRSSLGGDVETLFFNGAEGDLSIGHKSDLSAVGIVDSFRTFETAKRLGEKLANAVIEGLSTLSREEPLIEVMTSNVALPLKKYAPRLSMIAAKEKALLEIKEGADDPEMLLKRQRGLFARIEEYYTALYEASDAPEPKTLTVELAAILLGETAILTLPGEIFVRVALAMREASPFPKTLFLGLTNNYIGYLPDEQAAASSGYEVIASRVPALAGRVLQDEAQVLLKQIGVKSARREAGKV
jgi:neutral ceramidase